MQLVVAGQVAPGRRRRQGADPADRPVRRRPGVRHRIVFLPDYDMSMARYLYWGCDVWLNNPTAPAGGVRHVRHEVRAERRAEPVDPGRLVGRVLRRPQRLGDPHRRRRQRPDPPRRPGGRRALRAARPRRSRRCSTTAAPDGVPEPLGGPGPAHAGHAAARRCRRPGWCASTSSPSTRPRPPPPPRPTRRRLPAAKDLAAYRKRLDAAWHARPGHRQRTDAARRRNPGLGDRVRSAPESNWPGCRPSDVEVQAVVGRVGDTDELHDVVTVPMPPTATATTPPSSRCRTPAPSATQSGSCPGTTCSRRQPNSAG